VVADDVGVGDVVIDVKRVDIKIVEIVDEIHFPGVTR